MNSLPQQGLIGMQTIARMVEGTTACHEESASSRRRLAAGTDEGRDARLESMREAWQEIGS